MASLTNYNRVSNRIGFDSKDISSSAVEEYIEDAQAIIEGDTECTFAEGDTGYKLARAACTDLAAAYALVRMLGGSYSGLEYNEDELEIGAQQTTKIELINKYLARVNQALKILNRGKTGVLPRSTTPS